jgi:hypothetical protein
MNTRRNLTCVAVVLCIGALLFAGVASAQDAPDVLPATGAAAGSTANSYISQLDELRALGKLQVERTTAAAASYSSYEFSSDLTALHAMALAKAAAGKSATTAPPAANDYITTLDQLRSMGAK